MACAGTGFAALMTVLLIGQGMIMLMLGVLGEYLWRRIEKDGAMTAVAYSLFVEWNSKHFSRAAVDKARSTFGEAFVLGSSSHLNVDDMENHYEMMLGIMARLLRAPRAETALRADIHEIARLFREYFRELYEYTTLSHACGV